MTTEEMERAIEFLLDHHAKVRADMEHNSEQIAELTRAVSATQQQLNTTQQQLNTTQQQLNTTQQQLNSFINATQRQFDSVIEEMRDGFDKLIVANEVTRDLANKVAALQIQTSQRVTKLEEKLA